MFPRNKAPRPRAGGALGGAKAARVAEPICARPASVHGPSPTHPLRHPQAPPPPPSPSPGAATPSCHRHGPAPAALRPPPGAPLAPRYLPGKARRDLCEPPSGPFLHLTPMLRTELRFRRCSHPPPDWLRWAPPTGALRHQPPLLGR